MRIKIIETRLTRASDKQIFNIFMQQRSKRLIVYEVYNLLTLPAIITSPCQYGNDYYTNNVRMKTIDGIISYFFIVTIVFKIW